MEFFAGRRVMIIEVIFGVCVLVLALACAFGGYLVLATHEIVIPEYGDIIKVSRGEAIVSSLGSFVPTLFFGACGIWYICDGIARMN